MNNIIFAQNLQRLMNKSKIDRSKLCDDLGFKYSTVSEWLSAKKYPRMEKIEKLAEYIEYQNEYEKLNNIKSELEKFGGNEEERLTKIDILSYQIKEIETANLSFDEFEELKQKKQKLRMI